MKKKILQFTKEDFLNSDYQNSDVIPNCAVGLAMQRRFGKPARRVGFYTVDDHENNSYRFGRVWSNGRRIGEGEGFLESHYHIIKDGVKAGTFQRASVELIPLDY